MEQSLNGLKVMIIDDSKTIRRTAETLLQKEGCEVITAEDGFDAGVQPLKHCDGNRPGMANVVPGARVARVRGTVGVDETGRDVEMFP